MRGGRRGSGGLGSPSWTRWCAQAVGGGLAARRGRACGPGGRESGASALPGPTAGTSGDASPSASSLRPCAARPGSSKRRPPPPCRRSAEGRRRRPETLDFLASAVCRGDAPSSDPRPAARLRCPSHVRAVLGARQALVPNSWPVSAGWRIWPGGPVWWRCAPTPPALPREAAEDGAGPALALAAGRGGPNPAWPAAGPPSPNAAERRPAAPRVGPREERRAAGSPRPSEERSRGARLLGARFPALRDGLRGGETSPSGASPRQSSGGAPWPEPRPVRAAEELGQRRKPRSRGWTRAGGAEREQAGSGLRTSRRGRAPGPRKTPAHSARLLLGSRPRGVLCRQLCLPGEDSLPPASGSAEADCQCGAGLGWTPPPLPVQLREADC